MNQSSIVSFFAMAISRSLNWDDQIAREDAAFCFTWHTHARTHTCLSVRCTKLHKLQHRRRGSTNSRTRGHFWFSFRSALIIHKRKAFLLYRLAKTFSLPIARTGPARFHHARRYYWSQKSLEAQTSVCLCRSQGDLTICALSVLSLSRFLSLSFYV